MVVLNRVLNEVESVHILVDWVSLDIVWINRGAAGVWRKSDAVLTKCRFQSIWRIERRSGIGGPPGERPGARQCVSPTRRDRGLVGIVVALAQQPFHPAIADDIAQTISQFGIFIFGTQSTQK